MGCFAKKIFRHFSDFFFVDFQLARWLGILRPHSQAQARSARLLQAVQSEHCHHLQMSGPFTRKMIFRSHVSGRATQLEKLRCTLGRTKQRCRRFVSTGLKRKVSIKACLHEQRKIGSIFAARQIEIGKFLTHVGLTAKIGHIMAVRLNHP
jgi:hypothetical protein